MIMAHRAGGADERECQAAHRGGKGGDWIGLQGMLVRTNCDSHTGRETSHTHTHTHTERKGTLASASTIGVRLHKQCLPPACDTPSPQYLRACVEQVRGA